ncbi:GL12399 [Drosophila persimilis]|uniref:GL12399 n=1 Tax=Drosophila persimilis TaxID=7234 RepID=B4H3F3_DROPE|nr:GL12399 [Drosophila persimilis]
MQCTYTYDDDDVDGHKREHTKTECENAGEEKRLRVCVCDRDRFVIGAVRRIGWIGRIGGSVDRGACNYINGDVSAVTGRRHRNCQTTTDSRSPKFKSEFDSHSEFELELESETE